MADNATLAATFHQGNRLLGELFDGSEERNIMRRVNIGAILIIFAILSGCADPHQLVLYGKTEMPSDRFE